MFVMLFFIKAMFYLRYDPGQVSAHFNQSVMSWFSLPPQLSTLATRPWTLITHMFVHDDLWIVFGNMLWLWVFGYILQDLTGNRKIFPVFLYGAVAGAIGFLISYNISPGLHAQSQIGPLLGASAGIMAIAAAVTTIAPGFRIFPMLNGGIPIWILTAVYFIIDIVSIPVSNYCMYVAHATGAAVGYLFIFSFRRGYDWGSWLNNFFDWVNDLFNPDKPKKGKGKPVKQELFYKSDKAPFKKTPNVTSQRVDEILDKINQKGYNSLTEEEKELLHRASKEDL